MDSTAQRRKIEFEVNIMYSKKHNRTPKNSISTKDKMLHYNKKDSMYGADCRTLNKMKLAQLQELQDILRNMLIQ